MLDFVSKDHEDLYWLIWNDVFLIQVCHSLGTNANLK
jgi:hypothetical protein